MKAPELRNDYVLKLTGKAELPDELIIGHNYMIHAQGSITSLTESDKNDGSHVIYYKFEPVTVEIIDDKGERIKLRDTRSHSQLFRARAWKCWKDSESDMTFEDWYARLMNNLIQRADEIASMYGV